MLLLEAVVYAGLIAGRPFGLAPRPEGAHRISRVALRLAPDAEKGEQREYEYGPGRTLRGQMKPSPRESAGSP